MNTILKTNNTNYNFYIKIILICLLFNFVVNKYSIIDLKNPLLYEREICSFNGNFDLNKIKEENKFECICNDSFATDNSENKVYIVGNQVQCSITKKRQLIAFVLAFFFPIGLHYFYLEYYLYFILVFFGCCISVIGNCLCCAISTKNENKYSLLDRLNKLNKNISLKKKKSILNSKTTNKKIRYICNYNLLRIIFILLFIIMIIVYILNIFVLLFLDFKDNNGVPIKNDIYLLYTIIEID